MPIRPPIHRPPGVGTWTRNPAASDPYYQTKQHRRFRALVLKRDGYRCVAKDCQTPDRGARGRLVADHIIERRLGGSDDIGNGRTLCPACDNKRHREKGLR